MPIHFGKAIFLGSFQASARGDTILESSNGGAQMNCERARVVGPFRFWRNRLTSSFLAYDAALVLVLPIPTAAQRTTGTLRGQVLDPAGAR